jgi:hypothetical protein
MTGLNEDDRAELQALKEATAALAEDVQGLTGALEQNYAKKEAVHEVKKTVEATAVVYAEDRRYRGKVIRRFTVLGAALTALFLAVSVGLVNYADAQSAKAEEFRQSVREVCLTRNSQTTGLQQFIKRQVEIETSNRFIDDDLRKERLEAFAQLARTYPIVDCKELS